jgi:hypothetical protein
MVAADQRTVLFPVIHECHLRLHLFGWKQGNVLQLQGLEDVLMEIVVQRHSRDAHDSQASDIGIHTILPAFARLESQGLKDILDVSRELIEASWLRVVEQLVAEKGVSETSCLQSVQSQSGHLGIGYIPVCVNSILSVIFLFFETS